MQFIPQRLPQTQNRAISDTFFSQLFLFIDNRRKIKSRKTRFVGRPPLSRLRRRFAPLRGTQRRCAALRAAPPGRYAPPTRCARPFLEHEKKAGGGGNLVGPAKRVQLGRTRSASRPQLHSTANASQSRHGRAVNAAWSSTVDHARAPGRPMAPSAARPRLATRARGESAAGSSRSTRASPAARRQNAESSSAS